jgi:hypothetical protein
MAIVQPSDVADIYNYVWMKSGSNAVISGMLLYAKNEPYSITRWGGKDDNLALWTIDFNFVGDSREAQKLFSYGKHLRGTSNPYLISGKVTVTKVKGDLERFQKDWVLIKMFEHEWRT